MHFLKKIREINDKIIENQNIFQFDENIMYMCGNSRFFLHNAEKREILSQEFFPREINPL